MNPALPSTYLMDLMASIGINRILKHPAAIEADAVFKKTGNLLVYSKLSQSASIPVFAAVSPNLDKGP